MYKGLTVAVVVPAFNEARHIASVVSGCPALVDHVLIVDDHSSDGTSAVATAQDDPRVRVIRHGQNEGVGGALVTGYRLALSVGSGAVVVMAGDDQMDPGYLPALLDPLVRKEADFTKGNRFYSWVSMKHMPPIRLLGTVFLTWLTRAATGYSHLHDAQNGYVAISGDALARVNLARLAKRGYAVENEMLMELARLRARIVEVPIPARYGSELSTMRLWRDGPLIAGVLFAGLARRLWRATGR